MEFKFQLATLIKMDNHYRCTPFIQIKWICMDNKDSLKCNLFSQWWFHKDNIHNNTRWFKTNHRFITRFRKECSLLEFQEDLSMSLLKLLQTTCKFCHNMEVRFTKLQWEFNMLQPSNKLKMPKVNNKNKILIQLDQRLTLIVQLSFSNLRSYLKPVSRITSLCSSRFSKILMVNNKQ